MIKKILIDKNELKKEIKVDEYMSNVNIIIGSYGLLYYAVRKLGIFENAAKYDGASEEEIKSIINKLDKPFGKKVQKDFVTHVIKLDLQEQKHYLNVKRILNGIINGNGHY